MTREQFINEIAKYVQKYAPKYGIKVCSPIIAQAVLESASGTSELAVNANNFFGLKYKEGRCPTAIGIYYKVGSEQNADGSYSSSTMQWCKFKNIEDCVIGYLDFINISRYSNLKGVTDPKTYLELIRSDGYATSLKYVDNVYSVIQKYNLTKFDIKEETKMAIRVAIDAGHGSSTAGKRTPSGWREHWTNVKCANYFDIAMKRCGFETVRIAWDDTIATDDTDVSLTKRQQLIKAAKCNVSVSWHANAHGDGKTYTTGQGIETLIHNQASKVGDSRNLANKVQAHLIQGTSQKNRGVKTSNLAMCNCTAMGTKAAILIEIGFMTNEYEAALIQSDAFCFECAEEAAKGVCEYFGVHYITPMDSSKPAPTNTKSYLMKGDKGTEVKELQIDLNYLGYNCGTADGDFGAKTDTALRNFQKDYKLTVDGKYGATSKAKLQEAVAKKEAASKKTTTSSTVTGNFDLIFNATYYANTYPDLKAAFGTNATALRKHFEDYGMKEGRQGISTFNVKVYKASNADLQKAFGDDYVKYFQHYLTYGFKENRKAV